MTYDVCNVITELEYIYIYIYIYIYNDVTSMCIFIGCCL